MSAEIVFLTYNSTYEPGNLSNPSTKNGGGINENAQNNWTSMSLAKSRLTEKWHFWHTRHTKLTFFAWKNTYLLLNVCSICRHFMVRNCRFLWGVTFGLVFLHGWFEVLLTKTVEWLSINIVALTLKFHSVYIYSTTAFLQQASIRYKPEL